MRKRKKETGQKRWSENSGVTLIALSVTIIVLIILAGISINGLLGDDGIIAQAIWASFSTEMKGIEEQVEIKKVFQEEKEEKDETEKLFTEPVQAVDLRNSLKIEILYIRDGMPEEKDASKDYYPEGLLDGLTNPDGTVKYLYYIDAETAGGESQKYVYDELTGVIYKASGVSLLGKRIHSYLYGCKVMYGKAEMSLDPSKYAIEKESRLVSPRGKEWYYSPDLSKFDGYNTSAVYYNLDAKKEEDKQQEVSVKLHLNTEVPNEMKLSKGTYTWYDYGGEESRNVWANIKTTANGVEAWWVWVPRYAYKEPVTTDKKNPPSVDIVFISTDNQYYDVEEGIWKSAEENGYIIHPSFEQDNDLKGIWISKYAPSYAKNKTDDQEMRNIILAPKMDEFDKDTTYLIKYNSDGTYKSETKLADVTDLASFNNDKEWYDYTNKIWANVKTTANGVEAWWVWIPRYAYKLPADGSEDDTEIIFVGKDNKPVDKITYGEELPKGFIVHPAFSQDDEELDGIWMSKYAPSYLKRTEDDQKMTNTVLAPNVKEFDKENTYLIKYNSDGAYKSETKLSTLSASDLNNFNNNKEWYDYENKIWANVKTVANGVEAWWVWVPRYAYKIPRDGCADDTEIIFVGTDDKPLDKDKYGSTLPDGFVVHEAFEQDSNLQGIWLSKYAPSYKKDVTDDKPLTNTVLAPKMDEFDKENTYLIKYNSDGTYKSETKLADLSETDLANFNSSKEWYDYENKIWANVKTVANGVEAWWVWVPRYAYKIPRDGSADDIEIIFIGTDDKPLDKEKYGEELPEGFVVHPAFNQDTSLQGVWMSKYAPSKK